MTLKPTPSLVLGSVLAAGVAVRIASALVPGSMWFDELQTAVNVTGRDWAGLLEPLEFHQVAPVGFIAAEMASVSLFGLGETALRAVPLTASIVALFVFWRLATVFLSGTALYGAVAMFAVNPALVWYARKVKQYSSDVCVVLVLLLLAVRFLERPPNPRTAVLYGVLGGLAILFSQPAAVVAAGLLLVVLVRQVRARVPLLPFGVLTSLWALGIVVQIAASMRQVPRDTIEFMSGAWAAYFPDWSNPAVVLWLPRRLFQFVGFAVGLIQPDVVWEAAFLGVYPLLALLGAFHLFQRRSASVALLFTPLAVAILLSAARILPLSGRLMIYVVPTFVIVCFAGIARLVAGPWPRPVRLLGIALVAVQAAFLPLLLPILNSREDADRVLREMDGRWRPGDMVYVNAGAVPAMRFYGTPRGLKPWIAGGYPGADGRANLRELDALRGRPRAWLFLTHIGGCRESLLRSYLEEIGTEIDVIEDPHGIRGMHKTTARLYDLSDPERLSRATAQRFPLVERGDARCERGHSSAGRTIHNRLRRFVDGIEDRLR